MSLEMIMLLLQHVYSTGLYTVGASALNTFLRALII